MNPFMKMLGGIKSYMYEAMKAGFASFPVPNATGIRTNLVGVDQRNASKSQRIMRRDYGSQPQYIGIRRFERNATVHRKKFKPQTEVH